MPAKVAMRGIGSAKSKSSSVFATMVAGATRAEFRCSNTSGVAKSTLSWDSPIVKEEARPMYRERGEWRLPVIMTWAFLGLRASRYAGRIAMRRW
jgi:hypothetical protein